MITLYQMQIRTKINSHNKKYFEIGLRMAMENILMVYQFGNTHSSIRTIYIKSHLIHIDMFFLLFLIALYVLEQAILKLLFAFVCSLTDKRMYLKTF